ncbi:MAG: SDR family NAD(P)-dependent oxidoreductase, partial [Rhodopila sp.]
MQGQTVVSTGPYAIVRHPMYAAAVFLLAGIPLAFGSWWGLVPLALTMPVLIWRLMDEERLLTRDLDGYVGLTDARLCEPCLAPMSWPGQGARNAATGILSIHPSTEGPSMSGYPALQPGRVAVVTGAASGIGLAAATRFAEMGMHVALADLPSDALTQAAATVASAAPEGQPSVLTVPTDVSSLEQVQALRARVYGRFGEVA